MIEGFFPMMVIGAIWQLPVAVQVSGNFSFPNTTIPNSVSNNTNVAFLSPSPAPHFFPYRSLTVAGGRCGEEGQASARGLAH